MTTEKMERMARREEKRQIVDRLSSDVAKAIAQAGEFVIVKSNIMKDPELYHSIKLCLINKYGITEMEPWLEGEEYENIKVFIPASFNEKKRKKIREKVEKNIRESPNNWSENRVAEISEEEIDLLATTLALIFGGIM